MYYDTRRIGSRLLRKNIYSTVSYNPSPLPTVQMGTADERHVVERWFCYVVWSDFELSLAL